MKKKIIPMLMIIFFLTAAHSDQWHDRADLLWNEAMLLKKERNYNKAVQKLKDAVDSEIKSGNPRNNELYSQVRELGEIYESMGNHQKSIYYFELLVKSSGKNGDDNYESQGYAGIGTAQLNSGDYDAAIESFKKSLHIERRTGQSDRELVILNDLAKCYRGKKDFKEAINYYTTALNSMNSNTLKKNRAVLLSNVGLLYYHMGDYTQSLDYYNRALDIDKESSAPEDMATDLSNMGSLYMAIGKYAEARAHYEKSLSLDRQTGSKDSIAVRLYRLGYTAYLRGEYAESMDYYNQSLDINRDLNNRKNMATLLGSMGNLYSAMGKFKEALDYYMQALDMDYEISEESGIASRMTDIGLLYESQGRYDDAYRYFNISLTKQTKIGHKIKMAQDLRNIGRILIMVKRYKDAMEYFSRAYAMDTEAGDNTLLIDDLKNFGMASFYLGNYEEASGFFSRAAALYEMEQDRIGMFTDQYRDLYQWYILTLVRLKSDEKAVSVINDRSLKECRFFLGTDKYGNLKKASENFPDRKNLGPEQGMIFFSNLSWENPVVIYLDRDRAFSSEIDAGDFTKSVMDKYKKEIAEYAEKTRDPGLEKLKVIQGPEKKQGDFQLILGYYISLLARRDTSDSEQKLAKVLSAMLCKVLLNPIQSFISDKKELIINPDGALCSLPFESLIMTDGRYCAEKYNIKYRYAHVSGNTTIENRSGFAAFINGDIESFPFTKITIDSERYLTYITEEIQKKYVPGQNLRDYFASFSKGIFDAIDNGAVENDYLRKIGGSPLILQGRFASEADLKKMSDNGNLARYPVVHFGGRAVFTEGIPSLSALVLSLHKEMNNDEDDFINLNELSGLKLNAATVAISGSNNENGRNKTGEGIALLCTALLAAGTDGAMVPQWPVQDAIRVVFLAEVYKRVIEKGMDFPSALGEVRRIFINSARKDAGRLSELLVSYTGDRGIKQDPGIYSRPYFWSSYQYYGK